MTGLVPLHFGSSSHRLFGVFHPARESLRAALLICPPFLHEHARSYRLFALLADALSDHGIATLRFDYYGTGDSEGEDTDFTLDGACADAAEALNHLCSLAPHAPTIVMGVRGGGHPAIQLSQHHAQSALWLWQPITNWPEHLDELQRLHESRRMLARGCNDEAANATLMGFRYTEGLPAHLAALGETTIPSGCSLVLSEQDHCEKLAEFPGLPLPSVLANWISRPDMDSFPGRQVRELAALFPTFSKAV